MRGHVRLLAAHPKAFDRSIEDQVRAQAPELLRAIPYHPRQSPHGDHLGIFAGKDQTEGSRRATTSCLEC
jgi:hypothetical protein